MKQPDIAIGGRAGLFRCGLMVLMGLFSAPASVHAGTAPALTPTLTVRAGPQHSFNPQVLALYQAYEQQLNVVRKGGWPLLGEQPVLKQGLQSAAIPILRERLRISGDLEPGAAPQPDVFDAALHAAVEHFQRRHHLQADGIVGPGTRRALNVPAVTRLRQLAWNVARWNALRSDFNDPFVLVNLPEYTLHLFDGGASTLDMRVVIGKRSNPTPQLVQQMEKFVLNPTWFVPKGIGARELLPKVQEDQAYLQQQNFEVFDGRTRLDPSVIPWETLSSSGFEYSFRQRPGPTNSLGRVKFVLPNSQSIFLHDTPHKGLFDKPQRAFSHGCVRLEAPLELAQAVLELQDRWSSERVTRQLRSERTVHLELERPIPVYLAYLTAKVEDGRVFYFEDVYGHDKAALQQPVLPSSLVATLSQLRNTRRSPQRSRPVLEVPVVEPVLAS